MGSYDIIDYITIASLGNATDFGDLLSAKEIGGSQVSSGSRGVIGGGATTDVLQYITCASLGDAIDFGDLVDNHYYPTAVSNGTRGIWIGGAQGGADDPMDYITIATTGNASDFGD